MQMKVKVHWNLQKGGVSVTPNGGKVCQDAESRKRVLIANPMTKIGQGKWEKTQLINENGKQHKREVCAWISGTREFFQPVRGEKLHYNPYKNKHFTRDDGSIVPFNEVLAPYATVEAGNGKHDYTITIGDLI
jgi:hypothetical protein